MTGVSDATRISLPRRRRVRMVRQDVRRSGQLPADLVQLAREQQQEPWRDLWGNLCELVPRPQADAPLHAVVRSRGPDGLPDTADEICIEVKQ
jgi:hypothetical protein